MATEPRRVIKGRVVAITFTGASRLFAWHDFRTVAIPDNVRFNVEYLGGAHPCATLRAFGYGMMDTPGGYGSGALHMPI